MSETSYTGHAAAKVNLALHVTTQREDGYHTLDTLVVFARHGDILSMRRADTDRLVVEGEFVDALPADSDNLVLRAIEKFGAAFPELTVPNLDIVLDKNLPVAAGIGGGSADAAEALNLLSHITGCDPRDPRLDEVAISLGSDVPMCRSVGPKRVWGVGDTYSVIEKFPACHLVLVNPRKPVSTPAVFGGLKDKFNLPLPEFGAGWETLDDLVGFLEETRNDLQVSAALLVPEISEIEQLLRTTFGCRFARMSGSGATVFGLFATGQEAEAAATSMREQRPGDWVSAMEVYDSAKLAEPQ